MKNVHNIATVSDYNATVEHKTLHPLVSVIDLSKCKRRKRNAFIDALSFGFYAVFLKNDKNCEIRYGRNYYDYQEGTLVFIAPGQVLSIEADEQDYQPSGTVLLFHPDLIRGTSLGQNMKDYSFFSYDVHEALHLSEHEKEIVLECFRKIEFEIAHSIDKHSKKLIVANIELFLNYCVRFYDRQFITRDHANSGTLEKFEHLLNDYFSSEKPLEAGIPSVAATLWKADEQTIYAISEKLNEYLSEGMPKDEALRKAKLYFIENNSAEKTLPYYWANMILIGNTDVIQFEQKNKFDYLWLIGTGLLVMASTIIIYFKRRKP